MAKKKFKLKFKRIHTRTMVWIVIAMIVVLAAAVSYLAFGSDNSVYSGEDGRYVELQASLSEQKIRIDNLENANKGDICVCLGDSITGNYTDDKSYTNVIAKNTGMTVINGGFGGCRMAEYDGAYEEYSVYSMCKLADAIVSGDWTLQEQYADRHNEKTAARIKALKDLDWSGVDYMTIFFGRNDINDYRVIDNPDNPLDTKTFLGALRYSIEKIQRKYPEINIMVVTPIFSYYEDSNLYTDKITFKDPDGNVSMYVDWVDGLIGVTEEYGIPCVDLYRTLGINRVTYDYYYSENDRVHPNSKGVTRIGERLSNALTYIF